jgi:hypothetical protein
MSNRHKFLKKFIKLFLEHSVKRRSSRNTIRGITLDINKITRKQFDIKMKFTEEEVKKAFKSCGYVIMNSFDQEMDWEKWKIGTNLPRTEFINTKPAKLKRLISAGVNYSEPNWNPETIIEIDNLKVQLEEFWKENSSILE